MKKKCIIALLASIFVFNRTIADDITVFSDINTMKRLSSMSILEDKTGTLTFEKVIQLNIFPKTETGIPNLAVTSSTFWIKFQVKNTSSSNLLVLFLESPTIDEVELYILNEDGKVTVQKLGENKRFSDRKYNDPNYIFDVNISSGEVKTCILKVKSTEQMMLPLSVGSRDKMQTIIADNNLIFGFYCGFILVMFFYNLFVYFTVRDNSYLYYITYLILIGLTQISLKGYTFKYLWPDSIWLTSHSIVILSSLAAIAGMLFIRSFLFTSRYTPKLNKGLDIINGIFVLSIILSILDYGEASFKIMQLNTLVCSFYGLFIGYRITKKGYRPAKFFLLAWSILLGGAIIFVLKDFGVIPYNFFTSYILQIASALETILLSFALADRINILKKEKDKSQQEALNALKENEKIISERNIFLDQKVKERTVELQKSNMDLNVAMKDLKETQSQLVNAEKMASLGQLTAGVAHEINNPINFVSSSLKPLKRDITDVFTLLSKYEELSQQDFNEKAKEINELKKELDIDYLKEEIQVLLKGIDEGASRTAEIVKGLRNFSRLDELDLKKVDINEGLDSTLILLNSMMMDKIKVVKEYGNLPKIECYAGKLNQAFMNILNNAIYAIHKANLSGGGSIIIKTWENDLNVMISIKDNGIGMSEEIKNKIFEPFFTTKEVGEGTGLGMSIVYNIIENHHGKISVESEVGKGAGFLITIPKVQK
jgi:signal transduction histidine kinase